MAYLFDTNALSEPVKKTPNAGFITWFNAVEQEQIYTSCLVVGELYKGLAMALGHVHRKRLEFFVTGTIRSLGSRIMPLDVNTCKTWAELFVAAQKNGRPPQVIDSLIAAQAMVNNLTLVTRNTKDFEQFAGLKVLCPWTSTTGP